MDIGAPELLIVLVIAVIVFGVGRVGKLGGELGSAMREFRRGLGGDKEPAAPAQVEPPPATPASDDGDAAAHSRPLAAH